MNQLINVEQIFSPSMLLTLFDLKLHELNIHTFRVYPNYEVVSLIQYKSNYICNVLTFI